MNFCDIEQTNKFLKHNSIDYLSGDERLIAKGPPKIRWGNLIFVDYQIFIQKEILDVVKKIHQLIKLLIKFNFQ